jgi:hypothetical protein
MVRLEGIWHRYFTGRFQHVFYPSYTRYWVYVQDCSGNSSSRARTYVQSEANSAHFVVAAIGGGVVGLFNNFTLGQSASIPPLAIAFLVGYAVDGFFSFLENLLQTFAKRSETEVRSKAAAAGA